MGMISAVSAAPSLGGTQFHELFSSTSPSLMDVLVEFAVFKDMSLIIFDAFAKKGVSSNGTPDDSDERPSDSADNCSFFSALAAAAANDASDLGLIGASLLRILANPLHDVFQFVDLIAVYIAALDCCIIPSGLSSLVSRSVFAGKQQIPIWNG
jgi:hypothetical protein